MSSPWIVEVPLDKIEEGKSYFIALRHHDSQGNPHYNFRSRGLNGKAIWSVKPGIATRFVGGETLRQDILRNANIDLVLLEVPADADKRWKARKKAIKPFKWKGK